MHPLEKTKIVYFKTEKRKGNYENIFFDFIGLTLKQSLGRRKFRGNRENGYFPF